LTGAPLFGVFESNDELGTGIRQHSSPYEAQRNTGIRCLDHPGFREAPSGLRWLYNYPLGNDRFREQVETMLGKRAGQRQRGRPPKHVDAPK